ncbi:hypothetical protein M6B38_363925 [Iris pallida]|uniref:Secreted protein n=1 Tax=Iris pallida TaxID=29817 RepID=A0AAX6GHP1_IRIPA|nr:hypothetical protein M6B38_363925 [Iris pallida]
MIDNILSLLWTIESCANLSLSAMVTCPVCSSVTVRSNPPTVRSVLSVVSMRSIMPRSSASNRASSAGSSVGCWDCSSIRRSRSSRRDSIIWWTRADSWDGGGPWTLAGDAIEDWVATRVPYDPIP